LIYNPHSELHYVPQCNLGIMVIHYNLNLMSISWKKINSSTILNEKLVEYIKLMKIVIVQVLKFVEDGRTFNNLSMFMRNKLRKIS
jgi:hypothetical protein